MEIFCKFVVDVLTVAFTITLVISFGVYQSALVKAYVDTYPFGGDSDSWRSFVQFVVNVIINAILLASLLGWLLGLGIK